jgi:hypothetical protein
MCPVIPISNQDVRPTKNRKRGMKFKKKFSETTELISTKQWDLKRRFLCEFPIGFYVKLISAVGAIFIEGPHRRTHFWKRTIH